MFKTIQNLWFGSEDSYYVLLNAVEQLAALEAKGPEAIKAAVMARGGSGSDDPFDLPPLYQVDNGVATLSIQGSLMNGTAGFYRLFGVLGYGDIQGALAQIAGNKDVKSVVLNIDSGGGAVNGLEDTGVMIQQLDAVKPVIAYTGGSMNSAAYWLGISARKTYSSRTAQVGSVGTLIVHMDHSKRLADGGVKPTLVRFGKYKALANPYEPLSDDGKAHLQGMADEAGEIFVDYASSRRGVTAAKFQSTMGEGRVFMGRTAAEKGLIDGVMSSAELGSFVKTLDKAKTGGNNARNSGRDSNMKLSAQILTLILGGATLDKLDLSAASANVDGIALEAEALTALQAEATALIEAVKGQSAVVATATSSAVAAAEAPLKTKLTELEASVSTLTSKVALAESAANDLNGKLTASNEIAGKQAGIVKASISTMSVALGGSADLAASLTGPELLAEHERLATQFQAKFPAGGVAAVHAVTRQEPAGAGPSLHFRSLVKPAA